MSDEVPKLEIIRGDGSPDENREILQPLLHLISAPRKDIVRYIIPSFNYWLKAPADVVEKVHYITELMAESMHLFDDIEDRSELRRGTPAAHIVYDIPRTIACANYVQTIVYESVLSLNHPKAVQAFNEQFLEMHRCLAQELYHRETFQCPTWQQYWDDIVPWYHVPVKLLQLFSADTRNMDKLLGLLAVFSQMQNDYQNLQSDKVWERKTFCQDLTEGKFGFPAIHAIQSNHPNSEKVAAILKQRTTGKQLKLYCLSLMDEIGTFAYIRERLDELQAEIMEEINNLGGNPLLEAFVLSISSVVVQQ